MTNEEALEYAEEQKEMFGGKYEDFLAVATFALEKQIPKKPIPIDWEQYKDKIINAEYMRSGCWCPNCGIMIKSGAYCVGCGQRIDWSDAE